MKQLPKIALLGSHTGTNIQALLDACKNGTLPAEPALVISNNEDSGVLQRAREAKVPAVHLSRGTCPPEQLDSMMRKTLEQHQAEWIILAGYMRPIGPETIERWRNRIINIHPGKLPQFGGKGMYGDNVHKAVLESGAKQTTITVHYVDEQYDHGQTIEETTIPILPGDTIQTLRARVQQAEHQLYPQAIAKLLAAAHQGP